MFGEENLTGRNELTVDKKGRIFVPASTKREVGEKLVLLYDDDLKVYEIYSDKVIEEKFQKYKTLKNNSKNKQELIFYSKEIYKLSKSILRGSIVDNHGRILTGKVFIDYQKVLSMGAHDHLIIEPIKNKK